jgi:hypothetical protein
LAAVSLFEGWRNRVVMSKESLLEAPDALLAVADAAVAWWAMHRPLAWSVERHLGNPRINCSTAEQNALAEKVAYWVALQRGIR